MKSDAKKALRLAIIDQLDNSMLPLEAGGHIITNQLVYAGCSQWDQAGREWDTPRSDCAKIVDGQWQLTFPRLSFFDGHNQIERQTKYYLQPDRAEDPPTGPIGDPLLSVPDKVLLEIARGLAEAIEAHKERQAVEDQEAIELVARLSIPS